MVKIPAANRRPFAPGALALALMLANPVANAGPAADPYIERAQQFLQKGDVNAGVIELKNALQKEPENTRARLLLGQSYILTGDGVAAEKELTRARELGAARADWVVPLAKSLLLQGQTDRLLKEVKLEADDPPAVRSGLLALQGLAELGANRIDSASTKLNEALSLQADNVEALLGLVRILGMQQHYPEAEQRVEQVLAKMPDNAEALLMKAELARLQKRLPDAIAGFTQIIDRRPRDLRALLGRAEAELEAGEFDKALADANAVRNIRSDLPQANFVRARALLQKKDFTGARDALQDVLRFAPDHAPSQLLLGVLDYTNGNLQQAQSHLSRFVAAQPGNLAGRKYLAAVEMKLKNPQRAIDALEGGLAKAGDDAQYLALLGSAYLQAGESRKGGEYLQKAVEISPETSAIRAQLALSHLASGDTEKAVAELESVTESAQSPMQADVMLVLTLLQTKEFDKAAKAASALADKLGKDPMPYNLLGVALLGKGDMAGARAAFEKALEIEPKFTVADLNIAQIELRAGNRDAAEARYKAILTKDAANANALLGLAALAEAAGKPEDAQRWLEQAWEKNPNNVQVGGTLAQRYLNRGERTKAIGIARLLETSQPDNPLVMRLLGTALLANDETANALVYFRKLSDLQPKSAEAWTLLAGAEFRAKDGKAAERALANALANDPKYAPALVAQVEYLIREKRTDEARRVVETIKTAFPESSLGLKYEGDLANQLGDQAGALKAYAAAYAKAPNAMVVQQLAVAKARANDAAGAIALLQEWLAKEPKDLAARQLLALQLQAQGKSDEAIKEYAAVVDASPRNVLAINNLAWLYNEAKDPRAVGLAERAHELNPDSPEIADTLGWVLVSNGQVERGINVLQQAAVQAPHLPDIRYHLAAAFAKAGKKAEARRELEKLLADERPFETRAAAKALLDSL